MRKPLLILLAGAVSFCAAKPGATMDATVTGIADGTKVFLLDNDRAAVDSTVVLGGKFRFEIANAYPDRGYVAFDGKSAAHFFIVEPGTITAAIDATGETLSVFTGTVSNDAITTLNEVATPIDETIRELGTRLSSLKLGERDTPVSDSLLTAFRTARNEAVNIRYDAIMKTPNTVLAAMVVGTGAVGMSVEQIDSVLTLTAGAPANAFTDRLKARRDVMVHRAASGTPALDPVPVDGNQPAVGQIAPDFTQNQPDGTPLSLSSLRGKLVLIDFWASWCGPCRRENPNVVKVYNRFKDKGFEILGVSLDFSDGRQAWLKAIEDDGLVWKHVSDLGGWSNAVAKLYGVRSIPHTVLVGADGTIIARNLRGRALEAAVAEVLGVE